MQAALSNFLYIIGYWASLYLPPVIWENLLFRNPMSTGQNGTYNLKHWDDPSKLPIGYAAVAAWVVVRSLFSPSNPFTLLFVHSAD
jgi:purine-cytosine permease-like protein